MRTLAIVALLAATAAADPSPDQLAKDRADAAAKVYPALVLHYKNGTVPFGDLPTWSVRWLDASLAVPKADAKQALADHLKRMQDLETETQAHVKAGLSPTVDADEATYYRIEAQLWVARGKKP